MTSAKARMLVAGVLLVGVAGPTSYVASAGTGCSHVRTSGAWTTIDGPDFPGTTSTPVRQDDAATDGRVFSSPDVLVTRGFGPSSFLVSDQLSLLKTADGGCSWRTAYSVDPRALATSADVGTVVAMADQQYDIQAVSVASYPSTRRVGKGRVYALIGNSDAFVTGYGTQAGSPVFVASSADDGDTWKTKLVTTADNPSQQQLPVLTGNNGNAVVGASQLVVAPTQDNVVYLVLPTRVRPDTADASEASVARYDIYVSRDAGGTWHYASTMGLSMRGSVRVDPADPATLWTVARTGSNTLVSVSHDYGRTWFDGKSLVGDVKNPPGIIAFDVWHTPGKPALVLVTFDGAVSSDAVYGARHPSMLSLDAGRTWHAVPQPIAGILPFEIVRSTITSQSGDLSIFLNVGSARMSPELCDLRPGSRRWTCNPPSLRLTSAEAAASSAAGGSFRYYDSVDPGRSTFLGANVGNPKPTTPNAAAAWVLATYTPRVSRSGR